MIPADEYIESFCNYIEISKNEYWEKVYNSVNKNLLILEMAKSLGNLK